MTANDIDREVKVGLERSCERGKGEHLLGRKSVLLGVLTSGFVIANAAHPSSASAATIKSVAATQSPYALKWTPSTSYPAGQQVISPNNDVVSAIVAHTSASAYSTDTAKWRLSNTFAGKMCMADRTLIVSPQGSDANDGLSSPTAKATIAGALAAAAGSACTLLLAAGNHPLPVGVSLPSGSVIRGAGQALTFVTYTGTGTAFTTTTPGARTFSWEMAGFRLSGPGKALSTSVGIDLDSVSMAHLHDIYVESFGTGVRVRSVVDGGAVYNRLTNAVLITCGTGLSIESDSSNATAVDRTRFCNCNIGAKIVDSNDTSLNSCQIETNVVGVHIEASVSGGADYNAINHCRFESNTTAWETTANARKTVISFPHIFGTYTTRDLGQRTAQANGSPAMPTSTRNTIGAASYGVGETIFDTTLGKPIWAVGAVWKDAAGTTV